MPLSEQCQEVASVLRLTLERDERSWSKTLTSGVYDRTVVRGKFDGIDLTILTYRSKWTHVVVSATFEPPADLGLRVRPAGLLSKFGHSKEHIVTGDKAFDDAYDVTADEPLRAQAFLTPALREELLGWAPAREGVVVFDDGVRLNRIPTSYPDGELLRDVRAVLSIARRGNEAIRKVPASTVLGSHVASWRTYAEAHGLEYSDSPLRMSGVIDESAFVASAVAFEEGGHGVDMRLELREPLPWSLRVRPARRFDFLERTGESAHVSTGDDAFDHELRITTDDAERTRALIDADVRGALLELHAAEGALLLDARGLSVQTRRMVDPSTFAAIAARVAAVAHRLHAPSTAYRDA